VPSALLVVSQAGYWGEDCVEPLTTLTDAEVDVEVATPSGSEPVIDGRKRPYWVEDAVSAAGGNWDADLGDGTSVTVDGDLVTARGPPSSHAAAVTLLEEMGVER
jgi:putative intracellular protease/amidase